jgi:hypothetical protein
MSSHASFTSFSLAEENFCKLSRIESAIREFSQDAAELNEEIRTEEARVGIFDPKHFAYPCYAKAAAQRRDNLLRSVENLNLQLEMERGRHYDLPTAHAPTEHERPSRCCLSNDSRTRKMKYGQGRSERCRVCEDRRRQNCKAGDDDHSLVVAVGQRRAIAESW